MAGLTLSEKSKKSMGSDSIEKSMGSDSIDSIESLAENAEAAKEM